jgi:hypothetical protein
MINTDGIVARIRWRKVAHPRGKGSPDLPADTGKDRFWAATWLDRTRFPGATRILE